MELTLEQSKQFLQYLIELGVITSKEQTNIVEKISNQSKRCLFLFADFLKCLTPSDCYDVALRMMQVWSEKLQKLNQKQDSNHGQIKKNSKIPSIITEEENEDTQIELPNEMPYFTNQKNISEIMKKHQQGLLQGTNELKIDQFQVDDINEISNNSLPNSFYQNYCKPSFQISAKQEVEVQRKKRMDRTFVNEQLEKVSKLFNFKIKVHLRYSFQLLKNHVLKKKISCHNVLADSKQKQLSLNYNFTNNIKSQTPKAQSSLEKAIGDNANRFFTNKQSQQNQSLLDLHSSNNAQLNKQHLENEIISLKKFDKILKPYQTQMQQISQNKEGSQESIQNYKSEQVFVSNNSSVSYNNNNNNSQSQVISLQQSLKSEENKACTFRPLSTLISPTNNTAIKFNFSAINSANATPELYNRHKYFQYREQIMEYSPSSQSGENTQAKNNYSQLFSCEQSQENICQQQDISKNEKDIQVNNQKLNYQQNQFFNKEDEEIQQEFCQDLGLQSYQDNNCFSQINQHEGAKSYIGFEQNCNEIQNNKSQQQINANCQQKDFNEMKIKSDQQGHVQQNYLFTTNLQQNSNQACYLANIHNYSHISKNLDDSTSMNFECSLRSLTKPLNAQRFQSQNMFTNSQMNSFFMQSQDAFAAQQNQNLSQFGEQLAISQINPFVSEIQFSNNKNQFDSINDQLQNTNNNNDQSQFENQLEGNFGYSNQNFQFLQNNQLQEQINTQTGLYNQSNQVENINIQGQSQKNSDQQFNLKSQNTQDQEKQIEHIYIQQEDSQLLTDEDQSNQNSVTSYQNMNQNFINQNKQIQQMQKRKQTIQNDIQLNRNNSDNNQPNQEVNIQCNNLQKIEQQLQNRQQDKFSNQEETIDLNLIYKADKLPQYCFDEEQSHELNENSTNNNYEIQEERDLGKSKIQNQNEKQLILSNKETNQKIQQQIISSEEETKKNIQPFQQKNNIIINVDQPEQEQHLSIQPCQLQAQRQFSLERQEITNQNKENTQNNNQKNQVLINKSKSAQILQELYIDFDSDTSLNQQSKFSQKSPVFSLTNKQITSNQGDSVYEKLYNLSKSKEQGQKAYENIKIKQELKNCTFTPQLISKNKQSSSYNISQKNQKLNIQNSKENIFKSENVNFTFENFDNSILEIQKLPRQQQEESEKIKMGESQEKEQKERQLLGSSQKQLTYSRSLKGSLHNDKEKDSQALKEKNLSVFEKLYQDNQIKLINQSINQKVSIQNELQKCTFKPNICEQSIRLSRSKSPQSIMLDSNNVRKEKSKEQERKSTYLENNSNLNNTLNQKQNMNSLKNIKENSDMKNSQNVFRHQNNSVSNLKKDKLSLSSFQDMGIESNFSSSNKIPQMKSSSLKPVLKGCIDSSIDNNNPKNNNQGQKFLNNHFILLNQTSLNTPKLNATSTTFDQIISKKFKVEKLSDYNIVQIPSLHQQLTSESTNSTLRGAQSVKIQKSISFSEKLKKEQQKNQKVLEDQKIAQGSPLIQNCKYFQDDIIDENKIVELKDNNQPQQFDI